MKLNQTIPTTNSLIFTALLAMTIGSPALANPVSCENGELRRRVEVVYSDPGQAVPCEVIYDKSDEGSIEALWRANNSAGYCEVKAEGLIEKLRSMGWRCADTVAETVSP